MGCDGKIENMGSSKTFEVLALPQFKALQKSPNSPDNKILLNWNDEICLAYSDYGSCWRDIIEFVAETKILNVRNSIVFILQFKEMFL